MDKFETVPAEELSFTDSIRLWTGTYFEDLDVYEVEQAGSNVILHVRPQGSYDSYLRKITTPRYHSVRILDN